MSVDTHMRINLRSVAERLNMSEAQLARSVSASLPRHPGLPPMPAGSAPSPSHHSNHSGDRPPRSFPTTPQQGPHDHGAMSDVPSLSHQELSTSPTFPLLGSVQRSPGQPSSAGRPPRAPLPKPSAPIRVGGGAHDYGTSDVFDPSTPPPAAESWKDNNRSGLLPPTPLAAGRGRGGRDGGDGVLASTPSATVLVSSMNMRSSVGLGARRNSSASLTVPGQSVPVRSAMTRYATREEALGYGVPQTASASGYPSPPPSPMQAGLGRDQRSGSRVEGADEVHSGESTPIPNVGTETFATHAEVQGPADLLLSTNAETGQVEVAFVPRDDSPTLTRQESRLTRQESRLTRQESRLTRGQETVNSDGLIGTPDTKPKKPRKQVHFPTEPISQVTIFQTQDSQVVLQVQYRRPGWCLGVGAVAGVLRAAVWALASHALYTHIQLPAPPGHSWGTDAPARIRNDPRENIAIMLRIGFEIYGGCAILFALVMLIFWRPSQRDLRSLHARREQKRLAICVISGAVGRLAFVLSLGLAISATYVGLHHAMPLVWVVAYRSRRKRRAAAFPDLLAAGTLCAALAVMCAGDMQEPLEDWEVDVKWAALPLVVFSSLLRALQRYRTKSLKAHFSFRLMLLATMCADSVTMLIAALAADANVLTRIVEASSEEAISAGLAILAMTFAVISDVLLAKYFDIVSGLSLTALTLPAAAAFFRAFAIGAPAVTYIMISALLAILSTVIALGSGEVNRRTKNLVLGEDQDTQHAMP